MCFFILLDTFNQTKRKKINVQQKACLYMYAWKIFCWTYKIIIASKIRFINKTFSFSIPQNPWRCYFKPPPKHILQTKHIRLFIMWRSERNSHRWKLLSVRRLSWTSDGHIQRSWLSYAMHWILERKSQIVYDYVRWIGPVLEIPLLGLPESWFE